MKTQTIPQEKIAFSFPVQVMKFAETEGDFHIVGYAATSDFDLQGDILTPSALEASSTDLLKNSTVLLNHDMKAPIGRVMKVQFDKHGLLIDALISKTEPEVVQKIKEGILNKFSIRGQVLERERSFSPEHNRMVNVINRMSLIEVSLVSVPANPEAKAIGWYISKALEIPAVEGAKQMPEEAIVEKVSQGNPHTPAPSTEPPKPEAVSHTATPVAEEGTSPKAKDPFTQVQSDRPNEIHKADLGLMKAQLEPVFALLEKLNSIGGQPAAISQQITSILKKIVGEAQPVTPAPNGITKEDAEKLIEGEVRKQVEAHLKAVQPMRKGLIQQDSDADEVRKQFENLTPEQKLRAALSFQEQK